MSVPISINLKAGHLILRVNKEVWPLNQVLTFGSRINPKRSFLFVSKILGKYVPCHPSIMRESYKTLVDECLKNPALPIKEEVSFAVCGIAETATGLGAGFSQELKQKTGAHVFYQHTTRHDLPHPLDFSISESHSHAPSHRVYGSPDLNSKPLQFAEILFLVDDEISTGKTLLQLTQAYLKKVPNVEHVVWVSLVCWLDESSLIAMQSKVRQGFPNVSLHTHQLLQGDFVFSPNSAYTPMLPDKTAEGLAKKQGGYDAPRLGYWVESLSHAQIESMFVTPEGQSLKLQQCCLSSQQKGYVVIGTGEFTHLPFLLAEVWQAQGLDILYQSTGRSPALEDVGLESRIIFWDQLEQGNCYLYNHRVDRHPVILYESFEQMENCSLHRRLSATVGVFSGAAALHKNLQKENVVENILES